MESNPRKEPAMPTSPADPAEPAEPAAICDIAVLGAGPAGLAASIAAARAGARTALVDSAARVGGQYWRHREGDSGAGHHHWPGLRGRGDAACGLDRRALLAGPPGWHV